jgi:hypothetical protein
LFCFLTCLMMDPVESKYQIGSNIFITDHIFILKKQNSNKNETLGSKQVQLLYLDIRKQYKPIRVHGQFVHASYEQLIARKQERIRNSFRCQSIRKNFAKQSLFVYCFMLYNSKTVITYNMLFLKNKDN